MEIKYFSQPSERMEQEQVYGDKAVEWLYGTGSGKLCSKLLVQPIFSQLYGWLQDSSWISKRKIAPFIKNFNIEMDDFVPTLGRSESDPYASFNEFFIRRFKDGKRPFTSDENIFAAPCEARYFGHKAHHDELTIPVKGKYLRPLDLLAKPEWESTFSGGPLVIARLCPVDYHRFHFPDDGEVIESYRVPGVLHSVNPLALKNEGRVFMVNERQVSILQTKNFGKVAYIEVGAVCVGKIVQTAQGKSFVRGDEKGYFLFGGSTVILLGEAGAWSPSNEMIEWTQQGVELYLHLGTKMGTKG